MLKEILEKQKNNVALSEEEQNILNEYQENVIAMNKKHEEDLKALETKVQSADSQLQEKLKLIEELENNKKQLEETVSKSENLEDLKIKIRQDFERRKAEEKEAERKKFEEMVNTIKQTNEQQIEQLKAEMKKQQEINEKLQFKTFISQEVVKRPYMKAQLEKLIEDLETSDLTQVKYIYNFLVESVNHDSALEVYKRTQLAGKNIFTIDPEKKDKEVEINKKDKLKEFLKRNSNIR